MTEVIVIVNWTLNGENSAFPRGNEFAITHIKLFSTYYYYMITFEEMDMVWFPIV